MNWNFKHMLNFCALLQMVNKNKFLMHRSQQSTQVSNYSVSHSFTVLILAIGGSHHMFRELFLLLWLQFLQLLIFSHYEIHYFREWGNISMIASLVTFTLWK